MRRVIPGLVLTIVLTLAAFSPAVAAVDTAVVDGITLATEAGGDVGGLEPAEANDPNNEFAPDAYEGNFLWGGAVGLLVLVGILFAVIGGLYWLLVLRAGDKASA